jgi:hypothetical protein
MAKLTKTMEAAMAVLQATPERQLNITVLMKALFYLDLCALRDFGSTVTEQNYIALPQGPVVESYQSTIVRPLTEAGLAEWLIIGQSKPLRVLRSTDNYQHLSAPELSLAAKTGAQFGPLTSMFVSRQSHDNPGWQVAFRGYVEGKPAVKINMLLAMQQLHEPDEDDIEWMNAPLDEAALASCNQAHLATRVWE